MDFQDFSNERLLNMWKQGEYYSQEKLIALKDELMKRGLLTEYQAQLDLKQIVEGKIRLNRLSAESKIDESHEGFFPKSFWKPRYNYYLLILLVLAVILIFIKTGIFMWYIPAAGVGAAVGRQTIFKNRFERKFKR